MSEQQVTRIRSHLPPDHAATIAMYGIQTFVVLAIIIAVVVLAIRHDIRSADATTLLGTSLGYAVGGTTSAIRSRRSDAPRA